jgi:putative ABC transport system permease protein
MFSELRLAARSLAKSRGFTAVAVFTLAVGIGTTAAMFSALDTLVVHPFSYPQSERIAHVWSGDHWPLSDPDFLDLREQAKSFEVFGCYSPQNANLGGENPRSIRVAAVTSGVLEAFGIPPLRGRTIVRDDEQQGSQQVAVISHSLWVGSLGGDPDIVGKTIRLNGADVPVVGIMPAHFEFSSPWMRTVDCEAWIPYRPRADGGRGNHGRLGVGRLHEGVTVEAADAEIKAIGLRLAEAYPDSNTQKKFLVRSLHDEMTQDIGPRVWMLFAAVALVLVVACANVASMLLARSSRRQGEVGVRIALGAGRGDILRLALTESLVLSLAGGVLGLFIAYGGVQVLRAISPLSATRRAAMDLDPAVVAFTFGLAALATILAGLPPALATARTSVAGMLRDIGGRGCAGSRARHHFLRGLIIAQIALALVLANGAALFSSSYMRLLDDNKSLATENVIAVEVDLRGDRYKESPARVQFWEQLAERAAALPGVSAAGIVTVLPLEGGNNSNILVNDEVFDPAAERTLAEVRSITPGYFDAAGLALLRGRTLQPGDGEAEQALGVVVNRALAEKCWPGGDPIGKEIRGNDRKPWFTAHVVGVVESVRQWGPEVPPRPEMYFTANRAWGRTLNLLIRSAQSAMLLGPAIRRELAALDPDLPVVRLRTFQTVVDEATAGHRVIAGMINFFMAVALGLVGVGIYGTLSYHVLQRTREIGVRMALGALSHDITRLVLRQGGMWTAIGLVIGVAFAIGASILVRSYAYGAGAFNPLALAAASGVVALATVVACLLPARRAARVDPTVALRAE